MSSDNSEDEVTPPSGRYNYYLVNVFTHPPLMLPCRVFSCTCTGQNEQYMCIAYIVVERVSG